MSNAFKIFLVLIPTIMQCANLNTFQKTKSEICVIAKSEKTENSVKLLLTFKYFTCDDFLCRTDNLKLWKRRRRYRFLTTLNVKRDKRSALEFKKSSYTLDVVQTSAGLVTLVSRRILEERFRARWPVDQWRRYGFFSDDYLQKINSHWLQFPPPDLHSQYALGILYIMMMLLGCSGNAVVIFMYFRCRTLRTPGNILVANLALSDFLMLSKTPIFIFNSFNLGPALGKTGCVIYGFLGGLTGTTSIGTLAAISLDRYYAVVRPLESMRALTAIRARVMAVGAWIYAIIFSIIPALDIGYGNYVPEGYLTSCSFDYLTEEESPRNFIYVFFCAAWVAPFCTISFCYINIFRVVAFERNVKTKHQEQRLSSRHIKEQVKRKAEIKLAILVIVVIALFFVSWTPYAIVALLGVNGRRDLITPMSSMVPALFCKTTACINPFIYVITHPKFRAEFNKLVFREKAQRGGTLKTIGYTTDSTRGHRPSKDISIAGSEVEVVEMKDIPYQNEDVTENEMADIKTISSRVAERKGSQTGSMRSLQEDVVSPPSWYTKPRFAKKKSFHRRSSKSITSTNTNPESITETN